jgi:hypothetical protein
VLGALIVEPWDLDDCVLHCGMVFLLLPTDSFVIRTGALADGNKGADVFSGVIRQVVPCT